VAIERRAGPVFGDLREEAVLDGFHLKGRRVMGKR